MPEENFEQQARKMAEQFSMEPRPEVWQRVKAAIAPKRRRRAAFVWWLLPLCIVCGLGFWMMNDSKLTQKKEVNAKQNSGAKANFQATEKVDKGDAKAHQTLAARTKGNNKQSIASVDRKDAHLFVENNRWEDEKKNTKQKINTTPFQPKTEFIRNKNVAKQKEMKTNSDSILIQSQANVFANNNVVTDSNNKAFQKPQDITSDTAKTDTEMAAKTNDTLKQNKDSSIAIISKKKGKTKWQLGLTAEGGMSWLGNGLFGDQAKSLSNFSSAPTGMTNGGSQSSSMYQQRKSGVDAALGITFESNLSKHWFLDGALTYRYQQFYIQTTSLSSLPTPLFGNVVKSNMSYHFQSADLYAGLSVFIFHKKNASVALQAGIDNGWLLSIKQMHNDTLQALTAQGFRRWQPSLQFSVPVGIYSKGNTRWQLSPFVRWGLGGLQESGNTFAHHPLNAAGLKVTYFFK